MNHKLIQMLNEAGFDFTPDIMNKLQKFHNLILIEREACAKVCEEAYLSQRTALFAAGLIRARGQHD